jgi:hypothetical protein
MKVIELFEILRTLCEEDKQREVIMACDSEGNRFSPLSNQFAMQIYANDKLWLEELTEEDIKFGHSEESVYGFVEDPEFSTEPNSGTNGVKAFILFPIH